MKDQAEIVLVSMPDRSAQAQDSGKTAVRPVSRRFIGADHRESHAWIDRARRSGRLGLGRQWVAMCQGNIAKSRPPFANVSFAIGIERKNPGVSLVPKSLISEFQNSHEALIQECVVEPAGN